VFSKKRVLLIRMKGNAGKVVTPTFSLQAS